MCRVVNVYKKTLAELKLLELTYCSKSKPFVIMPVVYVWKKYIVDGCATYKTLLETHKTPLMRSNVDVVVIELECDNVADAIATRIAMNRRKELCNHVFNVPKEHRNVIDAVCSKLFEISEKQVVLDIPKTSGEEEKTSEEEKRDNVCKMPRFEQHEKDLDDEFKLRYCAGGKKITIPASLFTMLKRVADQMQMNPTKLAVYILEKELLG